MKQIKKTMHLFQKQGIKGIARAVLEKLIAMQMTESVPVVWSEYMSWLSFSNAGMFIRGNAYCFDYAIKNIPSNAPIIEIGSFCGLSTNMLTHCKERHGVKNTLITCDKWIFEVTKGGMFATSKTISDIEFREFVKNSYISNILLFSRYDLPYTIEVSSDDFFSMWNDSKECIDILGRKIRL
jgi:hypothetical protein